MPCLDILRSLAQKGRIVTRTAAQVRQDFIDFFCQKHGHTFVPSSPVVPHDDPTLLFANAGMNQFKPYFLGTETPKHRRVVNTQKCIRAGGKHNDLDDVGHDTYHHTFFEMLGNWSFGDYFKKEAIAWAWELLTKVWGLDKTRLHATYFGGDAAEGLEPDLEARDLWTETLRRDGVDASHVHPGDKKDNFWEMGETGPCGPCSEIHIDLTPDKSAGQLINAGDARIIEIWNLVFIQFNRDFTQRGKELLKKSKDASTKRESAGLYLEALNQRELLALPAKHVDTGMGFERVTAILQGHNNNYATDVFVPIIQAIESISGHVYGGRIVTRVGSSERENRYARFSEGDMRDEACRVIADHVRTLTFAVTDGAVPDKDGRGYVLRRILRRAVRFGWQYLDMHEPFLCRLVDTVVQTMGEPFPELKKNPQHVKDILREEEESFEQTIERGLRQWWHGAAQALMRAHTSTQRDRPPDQRTALVVGTGFWEGTEAELDPVSGQPAEKCHIAIHGSAGDQRRLRLVDLTPELVRELAAEPPVISGEDAFKLHDTYGFPIDLTQVMAHERGLTVDIGEYERLMEEARERARGTRARFTATAEALFNPEYVLRPGGRTEDSYKYEADELEARIEGFLKVAEEDGASGFSSGGPIRTGESAGIITDRTCFYSEQGGQVADRGVVVEGSAQFLVDDTRRFGDVVVLFGTVLQGEFRGGDRVRLRVDPRRRATMKNHTATHVLNWALREVLGDHVQQKGSLVDPEKTRFDFSHPKALTPEEIERVEQLVNDKIKARLPVHAEEVDQQQALKIAGLRAVFGERYPDRVRVLSVGAPVAELIKNPDNPRWRDVSIEFCGGTHVRNTGDIEHFVIASEEAVAKGVRRIVGLTGDAAKTAAAAGEALLKQAEALRKGPPDAVPDGLAALQTTLTTATLSARHRTKLRGAIEQLQKLAKEQHKSDAAGAADVMRQKVTELLAHAEKKGDTTIVVAEMPDVPLDQLKTAADMLKQKCGSAAVLFGVRVAPETGAPAGPESEPGAQATGSRPASERETPASAARPSPGPSLEERGVGAGKAILLAAMTPDLIKKGLKAGDLVKVIAPLINGGGGGPPTMAQAGGKNPERLAEALDAGRKWIVERL